MLRAHSSYNEAALERLNFGVVNNKTVQLNVVYWSACIRGVTRSIQIKYAFLMHPKMPSFHRPSEDYGGLLLLV